MEEEIELDDRTKMHQILSRHKARLMCNLSDASCPKVYMDAVSSEWNWTRSDLHAWYTGETPGGGNQ